MLILAEQPGLACNWLAEMRDIEVQRDSLRFRHNMSRIAQALALACAGTLSYKQRDVQTPLGTKACWLLQDRVVIGGVLRAGMPMAEGLMQYFDQAQTAFVGAARKHTTGHEFVIDLNYVACPDLHGKVLVLADPMLATGRSLVQAVKSLEAFGKPKAVHLLCIIAAQAGIDYVKQELPEAQLWIGDVDAQLNDHYYIVPGLGDAGDLAYGQKM